MALVQTGGGITDIRGSIGGTTFSRSAAGLIARTRRKPVNPNSALQSAARAKMSYLAEHWNGTLTEQQRADWRDFAANSPGTNKLGQSISLSGLDCFLRLNAHLLAIPIAVNAGAPTAYGAASQTPIVVTASAASQNITLADPVSGWDKDTDDDYLAIFLALPQNAGRVGNPRAYQHRTSFPGDSVAPIAFPTEVSYLRTFVEGQRLSVRAVHIDPDLRVSAVTYATCIAGA